jgi:2-oxoglutarate ferredoxin oxidoreductase subunit beta
MTGGQSSPTTPVKARSTTAPLGNIDPAFDLVDLAKGAGASFVARSTTYHSKEMQNILVKAIAHKGFSFVELLTQCPTYYGRKNEGVSPTEMMKKFATTTTSIGSQKKKENPELLERGIFVEQERTEYASGYCEMINQMRKQK